MAESTLGKPAGEGFAAAARGAEANNPGKAMYLKYCSACHGSGGKGDGVVSGLMQPRPTDLTQIAKKAGGKFPFVETMQAIDGTKTVKGHGGADMPVWGETFRQEHADSLNQQARVRGQLLLITEYLASIQEQ